MEIYKAPDFLIIQMKRFAHSRGGMFGSRKLGDFIDFPVNGLDMTPYLVSNQNSTKGKKNKVVYDLYGVSNHFGSLGGGHYTAFAKNPLYGKWYNFDDTDVSNASQSSVVTKAAYVLFYKLRKD